MCFFASYERGEPKKLRYRIDRQEVEKLTKRETEYLGACEAMGWTLTDRYNDLFIFRTEDENAPELHTDKLLYESGVRRSIWQAIGGYGSIALIYMLRFAALERQSGGIYRALVEEGTNAWLFLVVALVCIVLMMAIAITSLFRQLRKNAGRAGAEKHPGAKRLTVIALYALCIILLVVTIVTLQGNRGRQNETMSDTVRYPMPQLSEISADEGEAVKRGGFRFVIRESSYLAPEMVMLRQKGPIVSEGTEKEFGFYYDANYYSMRSVKAARLFVDTWRPYAAGEPEAIEDTGFDRALYIRGEDGAQELLLCLGSDVAEVSYDGESNLRDYLPVFLEYLSE